jgi:hypothetical protein
MSLPAFILRQQAEGRVFTPTSFEAVGPGELQEVMAQGLPAVMAVCEGDLDRFREVQDLVEDRGTKHPAKGLSSYLLGQPPGSVLLIRGAYHDPGQARRGLQTLLANARRRHEEGLYIVGLAEGVFNSLFAQGDRETAPPPPADPAAPPGEDPSEPGSLLDLLEPLDDPVGVYRHYLGKSRQAEVVRRLVLHAARTSEPVLILGDSGTGKEIAARFIHATAKSAGQPFVPVNCGGIPRHLLESELFGHTKGAYTGADSSKMGLWEAAKGGTIFLDEVGELAPEHQVKVLRALDARTARRVGGLQEVGLDARVIAATNRDLYAMVQSGDFRDDLYYRLNGLTIRTPSLREHPDDIPLLATAFWSRITKGRGRLAPRLLEEAAAYSWPGNARELKRTLTRLWALFRKELPSLAHLRAVMSMDGRHYPRPSPEPAPDDLQLHKARCLSHLKRVDEVLHGISRALEELQNDSDRARRAGAASPGRLALLVEELDGLCGRESRLWFFSEGAYDSVCELASGLAALAAELRAGTRRDAAREIGGMNARLAKTVSVVFQQVERLLDHR